MRLSITTVSDSMGIDLIDSIERELRELGHTVVHTAANTTNGKVVLNVFASKMGDTYGSAMSVCRRVAKSIGGSHRFTYRN